MQRRFMTGNEAVAQAALLAGAELMFGYPITPQTEIMHHWAELAPRYGRKFLQTEDELSAGFSTLGAIMAGKKAFTSTSGPGHVLMQEPISMAEMMRIPLVAIIQQRGGPSTATVIYSQQETILTTRGGNGEGMRIVYSTATHQELFEYTQKAFDIAWKYRFPTFILGDGYQGKMRESLMIPELAPKPLSTADRGSSPASYTHTRNTYNTEEELFEVLQQHLRDYEALIPDVMEWDSRHYEEADILVVSHGIVSRSCLSAVEDLVESGHRVGYFRPITLRPFPVGPLRHTAARAKKILVLESAQGQLLSLVKEALYDQPVELVPYLRPGLGITSEEVYDQILAVLAGRKEYAGT